MGHTLRQILLEMSPAETAKGLGLTYGGFGGWIDPKTRKVVARTVQGALVRVEDGEGGPENLGRINILSFDYELTKTDWNNPSEYIKKYAKMVDALMKVDGDFVIVCDEHQVREMADFMRRIGIRAGVKVKPIGLIDPDKVKEFAETKIKEGYTIIHFFDSDEKNVHAIESLRATFNRKEELVITPHLFSKLSVTNDVTTKAAA
jgi:hypothetical protein